MKLISWINPWRRRATFAFAALASFFSLGQYARAQQTVVANYSGNSLLIVDLSTGARTTLSDSTTGTGTNLNRPVGIGREANGTILVGQDLSNSVLFRVDPTNGNRTVLSSNTVGTGTALAYIYGITVDASGNIYTSNFSPGSIIKVDGTTGNRTVIASATVGSGAAWSSSPWGIAAEPDGNLIVAMYTGAALYRVNPTTGVRTVISSSTVGTGTNFVNPTGIARLSDGTIMVVNRDTTDYIIRVDPTTGNRTVVSSSTVGTGTTLSTRFTVSYDTNGILYTADFGGNSVVKIDPTTGNRTTVSSSTVGTGPNFLSPLGILPNAVASISNPSNPPVVSSATTASATYGSSFSYSITASNTPTSYSASGLPTGVAVDTTTGAISGTPTQNGSFTVTLGATNADGTGNATLTLTVAKKDLTVSGVTITSKVYDRSTTATISTTSVSLVGVVSGDTVTLDVSSASGTFDTKNVGTGKTVTITGLALGGASASNYNLTQPAATGTITAAAATVSGITITNKTYNRNTTAALVTTGASLNGIVTGDTVSLDVSSATATFDTKTVGTDKTVTVAGLALTGADAGNYTLTQPTTTATITSLTLTLTGVTAANKAYDGNATALPSFGNASLVGVVSGDDVTLSSGSATAQFNNAAVGIGKTVTVAGLTLTGADRANYTLTAPTLTADITKATATVNLSGLSQNYDTTPRAVTATTTPSGLTVAITYAGSGIAPSAVGSYPIVATISDANYQGSANATLVVNKADQSLTFDQPASVAVNATTTLNASASSALPVTFTIVSGNATLSGTALTLKDSNPVTVRATQSGDDGYNAVSLDRTVSASSKVGQTITFDAIATKRASDDAFPLSATATSGLPVSFTVLSGPAVVSGSQITLTGVTGIVTVRASQSGDDAYAAAADVTQNFEVIAADAHRVFFGTTQTNDSLAVDLSPDGTSATLLCYLGASNEAFVVSLHLLEDGSFETTVPPLGVANSSAVQASRSLTAFAAGNGSTGSMTANAVAGRTFRGRLIGNTFTGTIVELGLPFSAPVQPPTGPTAALAGLYQSGALNSAGGSTTSIVGTQGQVLVVAATIGLTTGGLGEIGADGLFDVPASGATIVGAVHAPTATISTQITVPGETPVTFSGVATTALRTDRLVNLSSRASVSASGSGTLITGFVIGGTEPKRVLLRAVGPTLADFGITTPVDNPKLRLFDSQGNAVAENDDWSGADSASTAAQVGAFGLRTGSKDAALLVTLAPGSYSMHVIAGGASGIGLAEIYDASANPQGEYQRLVNISTRGVVESGEGVLVGGFVVSGNSPKKVLIRGGGPALSGFGVSGALPNPKLSVYQNGTLLAQNDDWNTPLAVNGTQVVATSADIEAAARTTGAFSYANGSKDSAIVVMLAPGAYTAQVSSADGSNGVALVEIYEITE